MSTEELKIAVIGLDTSHAPLFAELLNNPDHPHHVRGGKVTAAYPGGSPDFELSIGRVDKFTAEVRDNSGVPIVQSIQEAAENADAILLLSVDGRVHLEQFRQIVPYGKPVFIDKPFAVTTRDAKAIYRLAQEHGIPLMSCSSVRWSEGLGRALDSADQGNIIGVDTYGPMELQSTQPGFYWYGIHAADMLYRSMGKGCKEVTVTTNADHDLAVGVWEDGRVGTLRGNRKGNRRFGALIHREQGTEHVDVYADGKPYYASMLEEVIRMFQTGAAPIDMTETLEVIAFLEAANESRETGRTVKLDTGISPVASS
ncbi:Gfo/Idh/MocA family oxidoreductase [Paenibacillus cellulositrophicus]|uniref:Gfo/Idh/MocA family protein n=1 Tax=Paenibacillus cellulositrophicus TaxID=562959 RepID=UPI00203F37B5|nr:Gfo/Idh/MocA family oxidoreductase [Paenibacillus cellulositrophicus]MCM3000202.1 Gfo/Idh/MocA family oxidoreductase [Paenibacillus cellulositrophicus]